MGITVFRFTSATSLLNLRGALWFVVGTSALKHWLPTLTFSCDTALGTGVEGVLPPRVGVEPPHPTPYSQ